MTRTIDLLGAGRAGAALLRLLVRRGARAGMVVAQSEASARSAVTVIGSGIATTDAGRAFSPGGVTLIGLPEHALAPVAEALARTLPECGGAIALHLAGSLSCEILAPLRTRGIAVGSMHPLAAFADRARPPESLAGTTFDLDGDAAARATAHALVADLGGSAIELGAGGKPLFHAAASVASNAFVALFDVALRLAEQSGAEPAAAARALEALARGTLDNLARVGSPAALTGPIERGEADVVARHLAAIGIAAPALLPAYRELARMIVDVAVRKGVLDAAAQTALRRALGEPQREA